MVLNTDNSDLMNRAAPAPDPTTILVVDDDPDILWSTAKILRDAGFVVLEGAGAADAEKLTQEHRPALVLLDVNLPDGNGVDVALQIKTDPLLSSVFVVLCSGIRITPQDQVDGLRRGLADGYIIRPVGKDELIARIDAFLRIRAALEALRQANKKLNLLSSITRHDILNQLFALKGYLDLSKDVIEDPEALREFIKKEQNATNTIEHQIMFTKDYQELGAAAPAWQSVNASIKEAVARLPMRDVRVEVDPKNPEIFADPLFLKVFYNLID
ncbi:MAG: response regulator, partial [Methanoregula sp.]|nr:response regulator [Methanoregula sp.]